MTHIDSANRHLHVFWTERTDWLEDPDDWMHEEEILVQPVKRSLENDEVRNNRGYSGKGKKQFLSFPRFFS